MRCANEILFYDISIRGTIVGPVIFAGVTSGMVCHPAVASMNCCTHVKPGPHLYVYANEARETEANPNEYPIRAKSGLFDFHLSGKRGSVPDSFFHSKEAKYTSTSV